MLAKSKLFFPKELPCNWKTIQDFSSLSSSDWRALVGVAKNEKLCYNSNSIFKCNFPAFLNSISSRRIVVYFAVSLFFYLLILKFRPQAFKLISFPCNKLMEFFRVWISTLNH